MEGGEELTKCETKSALDEVHDALEGADDRAHDQLEEVHDGAQDALDHLEDRLDEVRHAGCEAHCDDDDDEADDVLFLFLAELS